MKKLIHVIALFFFFSCGGANNFAIDLPGNYQLISEANDINYIAGNKLIPCNVIGYKCSDDYILACQEFNDSECISYVRFAPSFTARNRSKEINFWIIDLKKDSLWGPLNYAEYMNARRELNIDEKLKIEISL